MQKSCFPSPSRGLLVPPLRRLFSIRIFTRSVKGQKFLKISPPKEHWNMCTFLLHQLHMEIYIDTISDDNIPSWKFHRRPLERGIVNKQAWGGEKASPQKHVFSVLAFPLLNINIHSNMPCISNASHKYLSPTIDYRNWETRETTIKVCILITTLFTTRY